MAAYGLAPRALPWPMLPVRVRGEIPCLYVRPKHTEYASRIPYRYLDMALAREPRARIHGCPFEERATHSIVFVSLNFDIFKTRIDYKTVEIAQLSSTATILRQIDLLLGKLANQFLVGFAKKDGEGFIEKIETSAKLQNRA